MIEHSVQGLGSNSLLRERNSGEKHLLSKHTVVQVLFSKTSSNLISPTTTQPTDAEKTLATRSAGSAWIEK